MLALAQRAVSAVREGRVISGIQRRIRGNRRAYLKRCRGVIHVGANTGNERNEYAAHRLNVIWIEPIPSVFAELERNIAEFPTQHAINALITDLNDQIVTLHVANNSGLSSSILDLHQHRDIWPDVTFTHDIEVRSATLPVALSGHSLTKYDALVLDTQGSELVVLKGASSLLDQFRYIECEAADFDAYRGCATAAEIIHFLKRHKFRLERSDVQVTHPNGGRYFDLLFKAHYTHPLG